MQLPTTENVTAIRVVTYRNGAFVGVPYEMRPGQQPRDIAERYHDDWIWLGSPGWYGAMTKEQRSLAVVAMAGLRDVAWYEGCWVSLEGSK